MATALKTSRMDMRVSENLHELIRRAAELKHQTVSQWATENLQAAAVRDIEAASTTTLSPMDFEAFCQALEMPRSPEAQAIIDYRPVWEG